MPHCAAFAGPPGPAFSVFPFARLLYLSPCGKGGCFLPSSFALPLDVPTTGSHGPNGVENPFRSCRSPTLTQKSHTGPHRGGFGIHFLFLVCFCWGKAAKSCSSLQLTASWMGQIVNRSVPFLTSPDLVRTLVGSTSMSRLSSNCRIYFATVLALIPVDWLMRPMLGQH